MLTDSQIKENFTKDAIEAIYRYQLKQYDMADVRQMIEDYRRIDDYIIAHEVTEEEIERLAISYRNSYDCTRDQWEQIFLVLENYGIIKEV